MIESDIIDLRKHTRLDTIELNKLLKTVEENKCIGDLLLNNDLMLNLNEAYLIRKLKQEIKANNIQYERYPSDFIHALLSNHVFEDNLEKNQNFVFNHEKWKIFEIYQFTINENNCIFYAVLYFNKSKRQMVLAYRGIDFKFKSIFDENGQIQVNLNGVLLNKIVPQLSICFDVTNKVNKLAHENNCYLSFTGYSIGAWFAEYSNFFSFNNFLNKKTKAVLFESPGIFKKLIDSHIFNRETTFKLEDLKVVNYLLAPNLVNSSNLHCGKCYRLHLDEKSINSESAKFLKKIPSLGKKVYDKVKNSRFFLEGFIAMLNNDNLKKIIDLFDHVSGKPKEFEEIKMWPIINVTLSDKYEENLQHLLNKPIKDIVQLLPMPNLVNKLTEKIFEKFLTTSLDLIVKQSMPGIHLLIVISLEMLKNNIDLSQFECKEFYKKNSKFDGIYEDFKKINDFQMMFNSSYHTQEVNLYRQILDIKSDTKNIDWCLDCLKTYTIPKSIWLSYLIYDQLNEFKMDFIIKVDTNTDDNNEIKVIESVSRTQTIEKLKERFIRLTNINGYIRELLYEASKSCIYSQTQPKCKIDPFLPSSDKLDNNFIGRKDLLKQMHECLHKNKLILLKAFAGTGKSRLAKEFAKQLKHELIVRWFDAEKRNVLETSYKNLARIILDSKVFNELNNENLSKMISHVNSILKTNLTNLLFIFDNVEDFKNIRDIIEYLPHERVKILITSRNNLIEKDLKDFDVEVFELRSFNKEEAFDYIDLNMTMNRRLNRDEKEKLAQIISNDNEIVPIKLYFAVKYCDENHVENFDNLINNEKYIQQASLEEYLFEEVKNKSKSAINSLIYMGYLNPKLISNNLLEEIISFEDKTLLLNYSLIYRKKEFGGIRLHRLIKEEIIKYHSKHHQDYESKIVILNKIIKILVKKIRDVDSDKYIVEFNLSDDYAQISEILTLIESSKSLNELNDFDLNALIQLYTKYGKYLMFCKNKFNNSLDYLHKGEELIKILEEKKKKSQAIIYDNIGHNYLKLNHVKDALDYYKRAYKLRQELFPNDYKDIAVSIANLEKCFSVLGEEKTAHTLKEVINKLISKAIYIKPMVKSSTISNNLNNHMSKKNSKICRVSSEPMLNCLNKEEEFYKCNRELVGKCFLTEKLTFLLDALLN